MKQEVIDRFNLLSVKLLKSNLVDFEHLQQNKEITNERIGQLFFDKFNGEEKVEVIERYENNLLLNYLDLIFFDVLDIARPDTLKKRINNGLDIIEFLNDTNLKMEVILYIFDKFHEDGSDIRRFLIEHIIHLNKNFNWINNHDLTDLIESTDLSQKKVNQSFELLNTYKKILGHVDIYFKWYTTPPSMKYTTEIETTQYNYKYLTE